MKRTMDNYNLYSIFVLYPIDDLTIFDESEFTNIAKIFTPDIQKQLTLCVSLLVSSEDLLVVS